MPVKPIRTMGRLATVVAAAGASLAFVAVLIVPAVRPFSAAASLGSSPATKFKPLATRSIVYARDGSILAALHADENRELATLDQVPAVVVHAVIDAEDRRFYQHGGVDMSSIFRAMVINAEAGHVAQGGSTITQQLVKNELLTSRRDVGRKVREAALAVRLEGELKKDTILERYLNTVYFGEGAYGVRAAAEKFFGKDLPDLQAGEAALLAGMIRDPLGYNPFLHPEVARSRRRYVLHQMAAEGHLSTAEAERFDLDPLPAAPSELQNEPKDYFVEEVKRRLLQDPRVGSSYQQRYHQLFRGGLRIYTSLDPAMQDAAKRAVDQNLPQSPFTAALVSMDPKNGEVRALVGGPNFEQAKFNLATQGARQAGSAFKAVTLAAALENGRSPLDTVDGSAPCSFMKKGWLKPWVVNNYEPGEGGVVSLTDATVHSLNCAYANLVLDLGPEKVVDMAHRLGVQRKLDAFPSITLGTEEVSPLEMATVFATLADDGVKHDPIFVTRVEDHDGHVLFEDRSKGDEAVKPEVARAETSVLQEVIRRGTGRKAAIDRPAAGKTGTAEDWHDAWFCGFTPQLATAVWMGSPAGQVSMYNVGGIRVVGGSYPSQIWSAFMREALSGAPTVDFAKPDMRDWGSAFIGENAPLLPTGLAPPPEEDTGLASSTTLPPVLITPGPPAALPVPVRPTAPPLHDQPNYQPNYQPYYGANDPAARRRERNDDYG